VRALINYRTPLRTLEQLGCNCRERSRVLWKSLLLLAGWI
jgi:hypothetical protein